MARMTTRKKFRARRKARKEAAYWSGVKWSYSDLCILRKSDAKPLVFNTCPTDAFVVGVYFQPLTNPMAGWYS